MMLRAYRTLGTLATLVLIGLLTSAEVLAGAPPNAPGNLVASPTFPTTQINLTWTDNSIDEANFVVERSETGSATWSTLATLGANTRAYSDTTIAACASYLYRLSAINDSGSSASNVVAAQTDCPGNYNASLFQSPVPTNLGHNYAQAVAVGDLNGDGRMDVAGFSSVISIFYQQSDHSLTPTVEYPLDVNLYGVAIGDLNHDGLADLAYGDGTDARIRYQTVGGMLGSEISYTLAGSTARDIAIGDVNHDGLNDLVGTIPNGVSVLLQQANGSLGAKIPYTSLTTTPHYVTIGDVNNDGLLDVVVTIDLMGPYRIEVYLQNGGGTLNAPLAYQITDPSQAISSLVGGVAVGDVNGDGLNDVAVGYGGNRPNSRIGIFPQQPNHTLGSMLYFSTNDIPTAVAIADMDLDGSLDIAEANAGAGGVSVHFTVPATGYPLHFGVFGGYNQINDDAMVVGDLNGDCAPEIVTEDAVITMKIAYHQAASINCPALNPSPHALTFASQTVGTTSAASLVTLNSIGNSSLHVSSIAASGDFAPGTGGTCSGTPFSLASGGSCTLAVTFKPTAEGSRAGLLTISSDAWDSSRLISLSGTGTPATTHSTIPAPVLRSPKNGAISSKQAVKLSWKTVKGAKGYHVEIGTDNLFANPLTQSGDPTKTTFTTKALPFGVYFWHVATKDALGQGVFSAPFSFEVTLNKSPKKGVTLTSGLVKFKWAAIKGKTYLLEYSSDPAFPSSPLTIRPASTKKTSYAVPKGSALAGGSKRYYWHVSIDNGAHWTPYWTFVVK